MFVVCPGMKAFDHDMVRTIYLPPIFIIQLQHFWVRKFNLVGLSTLMINADTVYKLRKMVRIFQ